MFEHRRQVAFHEVDAAGIVFFPWFHVYLHEAMDAFFGGLEGGYARLINERRVGLPAVRLVSDFRAPLRYGDTVAVRVEATRVGERSLSLRYAFFRDGGGEVAAFEQVVVATDLARMCSVPLPEDVRSVALAHLA
ncbi:MAG: acyl-CoA thioesterase [Polyangiaceae bacterium]|nr:acyl-CoA thioesterase [Polyangiaceae bacterium]